MASVQQLEKLYQIQKIFYVEDSLEAAVAGERVADCISRTEQIIRQKAFLRDERRRLRIASENLDSKRQALALMKREDWLPDSLKRVDEDRIALNIGGLMFETPKVVLMRDPGSLLAQLCDPVNCPIEPDPSGGFFYFDRDWWLFRYILAFLRDGTLPDDRSLLAQLYREAGFWHLRQLQRAIEEEKLHLRKEKSLDAQWWQTLPSWWRAMDEESMRSKVEATTKKENDEKKKLAEDWWTSTSYKGKVFLPLSTREDKVVTENGKDDEMKTPLATWSANASKNPIMQAKYLPGGGAKQDFEDYGGGVGNLRPVYR